MEIADAQTFLKNNHHGVLVARKRDGSLQMTLVSPVIDSQGRPIITARETTYKVKNIKRDSRISLLVFGEQFHGSKYIQIDGRAEIIRHPSAMDVVVDWYRQLNGEHPNWNEYREKVRAEGRIAIRVTIERVGPQHRR
jgi:PPOX class probable F420-dependent enzyme